MKFIRCILFIAVMFFLFIPSGISNSQEYDTLSEGDANHEYDQTTPVKDTEIHKIIETLREAYLLQELGLPEKKSQGLLENMRHAGEVKKVYLARRYAIENKLQDLLAFPNPDQTQIVSTLQLLKTAQEQYHQQLIQVNEELQEMLTPEECAKYLLFQRKFNRKLKELITKIRQQSSQDPLQENQLLRRKNSESVIRQSD